MEKNSKIDVAGHRGMVGSAIVRELQRQGYTNIITRTHKELDLLRQEEVEHFFAEEKPEYVFSFPLCLAEHQHDAGVSSMFQSPAGWDFPLWFQFLSIFSPLCEPFHCWWEC